MPCDYLKERENDTCPVVGKLEGEAENLLELEEKTEFFLREEIDDDADLPPTEPVKEKLCESCRFRGAMWIDKEGDMTMQCKARLELEGKWKQYDDESENTKTNQS